MRMGLAVAVPLAGLLMACGGSDTPAPHASSPPATAAARPPATAPAAAASDDSSVTLPSECEDLVDVRVAYVQAKIDHLPPNQIASPVDPEALRVSLRRQVARDGYDKTADSCRQLADYHRAHMPGEAPTQESAKPEPTEPAEPKE
jgi:hypothetical protein